MTEPTQLNLPFEEGNPLEMSLQIREDKLRHDWRELEVAVIELRWLKDVMAAHPDINWQRVQKIFDTGGF